MKISKGKIVKLLIWVMILLIVIGAVVLWRLNKIAAAAIRTVGSSLTGTEVVVNSVSISPLAGVVKLNGFAVGNPSGFHFDHAVKVGKFHIDADMGSLFGDRMVIEYLELSDVRLDYEYRLAEGSNLNVILKNIEKATGGAAPAAAAPRDQKNDAAAKPVVINKLVLRNIVVSVSSATLHSSMKIPLPPIEMTQVGGGRNIAAVTAEVLQRILLEIAKVVDVKKLGQSLNDVGNATLDTIDKATDTVGGVVVSAGDVAGGAVQDALNRSRQLIKVVPGAGR